MPLPPPAKRPLKELSACLFLLALGFLFYRPETDFLHSHYTILSFLFERAGRLVNPEYTNFFQDLKAEACWPLPHLVAHFWMRIFHANLENVLLFHHSTFILLSLLGTYGANRLFFSRTWALILTILLLFDRVLLPLGRGMGLTSVPLLLPLILFFIYFLARIQNPDTDARRRFRAGLAMAACLAFMLTLGGHETIFAIGFFAIFFPLLALDWVNRCRIAKQLLPAGARHTLLALAGGIVLAATLLLASRQVVPPEQDRASLRQTFTFGYIGVETKKRMLEEPGIIKGHRKRIIRGTFIEGRFLSIEPGKFYHRHEERTFLYPGQGFNGIVPLALIPGFLLGLGLLLKKVLALLRDPEKDKNFTRREKYFLFSQIVLLIHFAGIVLLTATPKPSRYSLAIYAILTCAIQGYAFLYSLCARHAKKWGNRFALPEFKRERLVLWAPRLLVLFPLLLCLDVRISKNYRDLQDYIQEYWIQARTKAITPVFHAAQNAFADKKVVITYYWNAQPEQGLLLRYRPLENVEMYERLEDAGEIDPEAIYYVWQDLGKHKSYFRVFRGSSLQEPAATEIKFKSKG